MQLDKLIISVFLTGFIGDIILQILIKNLGMGGKTGWGLKSYFLRHGSFESLCIAGGMLTLFYIVYLFIKLPISWYWLGIYGVFLDYIFRRYMLFSSLNGYYKALNYFWSAFWGFIPMIIPLGLYKLIN